MALAESERAVLAVVMDRNDLAPVLFDNLARENFHGAAAVIFDAMLTLHGDGMDLLWSTVKDHVGQRVNPGIWQALMDSTRGVHPSGAEAFLRERVQAIKVERAKYALASTISRVAEKDTVDDEDIDQLERTARAMRMVDQAKETPTLASALAAYREHIRRAASDITLGFDRFDRLIDGLNRGEIVVIMARPGVGKTFVALNIIDHLAAKIPYKIGFFSLEMAKAAIIERLLEIHLGLGRREVKDKDLAGELDSTEFEQTFAKLYVYEKTYSVSEIRKIVEREGFRVVVVDFMHLVRAEIGRTPYEQISAIMQGLKHMAKDTGCVAILLHQLSRQAGSGEVPVEASHARDAGTIEELADFLFGVWAPGLKPGSPPEMDSVLSVAMIKNKRGARVAVDLVFDKHNGRIYEGEDEDGHRRETRSGQRRLHDWSEPGTPDD